MAGNKASVCAVVGVGPGNGEAFAQRFAADGYAIALLARRPDLSERLAKELPRARAYSCDASDAGSVEAAFGQIHADLGDVDVLIFNAGSGVWGTIEDVSPEDFERAWRVNALGLFLAARQAIPAMRRRGQGAIIVVGATASRRGVAGTAAFAPAKMAQKALAEFDGAPSMARRHSCGAHHRRRAGALASRTGALRWPAGRRLYRALGGGRHRRESRSPESLGLELRGRGAALRREVVKQTRFAAGP